MEKSQLMHIPMEISIGGIYFPPIMLAIAAGTILAWCVAMLLNRFELTRFIWYPPLFFFAMVVICTWLVSLFFIPI